MTSVETTIEHLRCPICFELPETAVFQCRSGHTICKACIEGLKKCPQCRVPFDGERIRNLVVESLLENVEVDCNYQSEGCTIAMVRKDMREHRLSCDFRPVNFCKEIGFLSCDYSGSGLTLIEHMLQNHRIGRIEGPPKQSFTLPNFGTFLDPGKDIYYGKVIWETGVEDPNPTSTFVLCTVVNAQRGDYSFVCILMDHSSESVSQFEVDFSIMDSRSGVKIPVWKWSGKPTHYKNVGITMDSPPFRIPLKYLTATVGGTEEYALEVDVEIRKVLAVEESNQTVTSSGDEML